MAKRKPDPPKKGAPAWQCTFADLMNLLLCFFVLLFSMSNVDAQKFELVAASFSQTFSVFSAGSTAIGEGALIGNGISQLNNLDQYMNSTGYTASDSGITDELDKNADDSETEEKSLAKAEEEVEAAKLAASEELVEKVQEAMQEVDLSSEVELSMTAQYVQLTLNGALLFDSGSANLKEESLPVLDKVGIILQRYATSTIEIEGHTDNVPVSAGARYANNNELSSARALSVFDYLVANTSLNPAQIKHAGRGEYVPVADNSVAEGRARNRRVEIRIYHSLSES